MVTLNLTVNKVNVNVSLVDSTITAESLGATYQWLDCERDFQIIQGEINQSYKAKSNGKYAVSVKENGCVDTSVCTTVIIEDTLNGAIIYPNPTFGEIKINFGINKTISSMRVFTIQGNLVLTKEDISESPFTFHLNKGPGIYFLELEVEKDYIMDRYVKKIIVLRE